MKRILSVAALVALAGCGGGSMFDSKVDYKSERTLPPLDIPPDLSTPTRDSRFAMPESARSTTLSGYQAERKDQVKGGNSGILPQPEQMRIERAGNQRWLVVQEPAEKLWPLVKDFWLESGFLLQREQPEVGVLETDWAENRAKLPQDFIRGILGRFADSLYSTSERDKFRTRLERTADGKGTEIYLSHRGMVEVYTPRDNQGDTGRTVWQPREPDVELEAEFLRRLMVRLGAQDERANQLLANNAAEARAQILKGNDGTELLQVQEPFDRAWRRVGLALDRVGFTVEDRDRQKGLYFVRYADPESEMTVKDSRGLFSRIFSNADPKVKAEQYRVQVRQGQEGRSQVNVLNKDGAADSSRTAQRILSLLAEQLK